MMLTPPPRPTNSTRSPGSSRSHDRHRGAAGSVQLGWTGFCESDRFEPLVVRDGEVVWP
ncbi:hypothetical protein [Streptomyces sp. IMTB 2501]|uniref:hypothetical protein n=1 Tax=Streptomyces sp. IMTB 2501 TaxID=1776340 RepID=UPI0015BF388D|nr:hypothetical protein [Streptomyces sp. IMTB 2501]